MNDLRSRLDALEADPPRPMELGEMDFWDLVFAVKHGRAPHNKAESRSVETMTEDELDALMASVEAESLQ